MVFDFLGETPTWGQFLFVYLFSAFLDGFSRGVVRAWRER